MKTLFVAIALSATLVACGGGDEVPPNARMFELFDDQVELYDRIERTPDHSPEWIQLVTRFNQQVDELRAEASGHAHEACPHTAQITPKYLECKANWEIATHYIAI